MSSVTFWATWGLGFQVDAAPLLPQDHFHPTSVFIKTYGSAFLWKSVGKTNLKEERENEWLLQSSTFGHMFDFGLESVCTFLLSELSLGLLATINIVLSCSFCFMFTTRQDDARLLAFKKLPIFYLLTFRQFLSQLTWVKEPSTGKQEPNQLCSSAKLKSMNACEPGHHQKYMSKSVCQIDHWLTRLRLCLIDSPFSCVSGESSPSLFSWKVLYIGSFCTNIGWGLSKLICILNYHLEIFKCSLTMRGKRTDLGHCRRY